MKMFFKIAGMLGALAFMAALPAGCAGAPPNGGNSAAGAGAGTRTVRLVDGTGRPVPEVRVLVYASDAPGRPAGATDAAGEIALPVKEGNVYLFSKNGQTLLGQTAANLFFPVANAGYLYRHDGDVIVVPLTFSATSSPLVSPIVDPLKAGK